MENIHFTIENKSLSSKSSLVENILKGIHSFPNLKNKKGLLFSNSILDRFIDEEDKHSKQTLTSKEKRSIRTLSSGEQKKALLNYLLQQKPDFLILDSPFESLDIASVSNLSSEIS